MSTTTASAASPSGQAFSSASDARERIVERIHEHAAHHIDDEHALALARLIEVGAAARRAGGIVARAQDAVVGIDEGEDFLLVEPVIAGGDTVHARAEEFVRGRAREPEAARRVLAIGDHEIEPERVAQARKFRRDHVAARLSDDVADE